MRIGILRRDDRSAAFFDAAARGQLLIRRCGRCGRWLAPEAGTCYQCGAENPGWALASGHGTLVSWAVLHPRPSPSAQPARPVTGDDDAVTVLALVELDEGPWLHTVLAVTGRAAIGALHAGQRVAASFTHPAEGESYPPFRPATAEDPDP